MLYHVSRNISDLIETFTPRIPKREQRMEGENDYIPRICVGQSVEDCLSAMPEGGYKLEKDKPKKIRVYAFDEKDISSRNLLNSVDLYFSGWVLDAWVTGEHWILEEAIKPVSIFDVEINNYEVVDAPFVTPDLFKAAFQKKGNPADILEELEEESKESVARVTNLSYRIINQLK